MSQPNTLPPLLPTRDSGVLTITLNRPEARNALSESLMRALQLTLDEAVDDVATKVIIIAAKGPAFSAGHDLKEMSARRADALDRFSVQHILHHHFADIIIGVGEPQFELLLEGLLAHFERSCGL